MNRRRFVATISGAITLSLPTVVRAALPDGEWTFVGGPSELASLDASIDRAIASVPTLLRGVARRRLSRGHRPSGPLRFSTSGARTSILMSGKAPLVGAVDGPAFDWVSVSGERLRARLQTRPNGVLARFWNDHGRSRMHLDVAGQTLSIDSRISDDRLAEALVYRLTYRRRA